MVVTVDSRRCYVDRCRHPCCRDRVALLVVRPPNLLAASPAPPVEEVLADLVASVEDRPPTLLAASSAPPVDLEVLAAQALSV